MVWVKIHRIYHETEPGSDSALQITSYVTLSEVLILTGPTFSVLKGHHINSDFFDIFFVKIYAKGLSHRRRLINDMFYFTHLY